MSRFHFRPARTPRSAQALLVLASLAWIDASAGTAEVQRCSDSSGAVVYTDRPCASLRATPLPMSAAMRLRIEATAPRGRGPDAGIQPAAVRSHSGPVRRSLGCARSTAQLSRQVQQAVALQDVNRLAESYHWIDQSNARARQLMLQLQGIVSRPLLDARLFDARLHAADAPASEVDASAGIMQIELGPDESPQLIDLDLVRYAGCYFARFRSGDRRG